MLRESVEEKGCFSGCMPFLFTGALIGVFLGMNFFEEVCAQYGLAGPIGKITGIMLGFSAGSLVGGLIGLIFGRIMSVIKRKEEDF